MSVPDAGHQSRPLVWRTGCRRYEHLSRQRVWLGHTMTALLRRVAPLCFRTYDWVIKSLTMIKGIGGQVVLSWKQVNCGQRKNTSAVDDNQVLAVCAVFLAGRVASLFVFRLSQTGQYCDQEHQGINLVANARFAVVGNGYLAL